MLNPVHRSTTMDRNINELVKILKSKQCQSKTNVELQRSVAKDGRFSTTETLTLYEYIIAKKEICKRDHTNCTKCKGDINAAKIVLKEKVVPLPILWRRSFEGSMIAKTYREGCCNYRLLP